MVAGFFIAAIANAQIIEKIDGLVNFQNFRHQFMEIH